MKIFKVLFISILIGFIVFLYKEIITKLTISLSFNFIFAYLLIFLIPFFIGLYQVVKSKMNNIFINNYNKLVVFVLTIFLHFTFNNNAKEILIYADDITYDQEENIIAKGNAKIFYNNELIVSDLIIYEKNTEKIILPIEFVYKDASNNFINGENGYFNKELNYAEFDNPKIRLNDGSRIIGKKIKREGDIDIISKGVYTPCKSRIKIANFICPTWQLEGEKILHIIKIYFYIKNIQK